MRKKIATAAVAIGCLAAPVLGMGTANAEGSTAPFKVNVGFSGATNWTVSWDASGANVATNSCNLEAGPGRLFSSRPATQGPIAIGAVSWVQIDCKKNGGTDRIKSSKVHIYGPRGAINDLRTKFSNDTQGMFGS